MFDKDITTPSTDGDLRNATHNKIKIIDYDGLAKYNDIDELLPYPKSSFILLYEDSQNSGHWTACGRDVNDNYWFFCSYGSDVDEPLTWTPKSTRIQLGAGQKYLSKILNGREVLYNSTPFQDENTNEAVCGDMVAFVVNQNREGIPFETILDNLQNLKKPYHKSYAHAIIDYWN